MNKTPVIQLTDITKTYEGDGYSVSVLHGISLSIYKGEFIAITGPSGSGKSTLLNILGLLDTATDGRYMLNGNDVTKLTEDEQALTRNKEIGFVFQSFNLLKRASVLDNVVLPSIYAGLSKTERERRGKELLRVVGLEEHMQKKPNQLSGGQQQRVAIARALMNDPVIILADEPTGNLDTKSGQDVMDFLKKLNKEGKTVILITHEKDIANQAQKTIFVRDGLVEKEGKI